MWLRRDFGNGENIADREVRDLRFVVRVVVFAIDFLDLFLSGEESAIRDGCTRGRHRRGAQRANRRRHRDGHGFTGRIDHL